MISERYSINNIVNGTSELQNDIVNNLLSIHTVLFASHTLVAAMYIKWLTTLASFTMATMVFSAFPHLSLPFPWYYCIIVTEPMELPWDLPQS